MAILVTDPRVVFRDLCSHLDTRLSSTRATFIALVSTLFETFDVPVYWPILVLYFFVLFALTMRRQIQYVLDHCTCCD